ncbi:MAG: hypothetical protein ACLGG9_04800, partial [Thermoleophilia bacterium]
TAIARALAELIADPPGPEACRAAAAPHALSVQAAKITAILRSAAEGPAEPASDPTAQAAGEHP